MSFSRSIRLTGILMALALGLLLSGQLSAGAQADGSEPTEQGARLYVENCAVCHGEHGEGRVGAALAKDWPSIRPSLTVQTVIENGIPGSVMPAWSQTNGGPLSDEEIGALVSYILSWQTAGTTEMTPPPQSTARSFASPPAPVEGDPQHGAVLFAENCAVCHGEHGEGRVGAALAKDWPSIRPDLTVKTTIEQGIPGSVMPAWLQAYGGPLNEQEVNDLVAFLVDQPSAGLTQVGAAVDARSPRSIPWIDSWVGVLLAFSLLVLVIGGALIFQRRGRN